MNSPPTLAAIRMKVFSSRWYSQFPEAVRLAVKARAKVREFNRGERIFGYGDQVDGMYYIEEGAVRLDSTTLDGRGVIFDICGPDSWFGESSPLIGFSCPYGAICHSKALVHHMKTEDIYRSCDEFPEFNKSLLQLFATKSAGLTVALQMYQAWTLEQKLANRIIMLDDSFGRDVRGKTILDVKLSQEIIAQLVGATTRQRVNQILGQWEDAGILSSSYGVITIKDRHQLEEIVKGSRRQE